jgi:YVTN family beta-propeller protein
MQTCGPGSLAKSSNGRDNSMLPARPRPRAEWFLMPGGATEVTQFDQQTGGTPHEAQPPQAPPQQGPPMGWSPPPAPPANKNGRLVVILALVAIVSVAVTLVVVFSTLGGKSSDSPTPGVAAAVNPGPLPQKATPVANSVATPTVGNTVFVGPTPGYLEIAPNGAYGYIANRAANVLTVFDVARDTVTGTIPVRSGGPQFVAFSPDGNRAYVSIFNADRTVNEVGVLDTATGAFTAHIPVGVRPFALVVSPDGSKVYVPNHDSGGITVIDTASNTVTGSIQVAPNPHWLAMSKDGSRMYAANHESNLVTVIDTSNDAILATVPVGQSPHSIVAQPNKPVVYVVNYDSSSVSVIDTTTNTVTATVPTGSHPQDVSLSTDGKHAYLACVDENAIEVLDTATLKITAKIPVGQSPTSIAVSADGRHAFVTNLADGTVTTLNIAGTA